jgi:hypothetical protein
MIIDCKEDSSLKAVLDKDLVKFIVFNSKRITFESKIYFVTNIYAFIGEGDAVRLRKIYTITDDAQINKLADEFSKTLTDLNEKYAIVVFEGSIKEEDATLNLFKK